VFKKLIVGMDFSELSDRAARTAVGLGKDLGGEVVLVHVVAPQADLVDPLRFAVEIRPSIERRLRELSARLVGVSGAKVDWGVVDGRPAEELALFAERWGGDLLVVGTAGHAGLPRMLLGSVAERLLRIAHVPVLVVGPEKTP
jgi:nucleotide-binding universal stress UspA family protein